MALFHVTIRFDPSAVPAEDLDDVLVRERARGLELRRAGALQRIWRVPATSGSLSIWEAASESDLRAMLGSLPIAPWTDFDVVAIEPHPLEAEPTG